MTDQTPLLEARGVSRHYPVHRGRGRQLLRAVEDVSLTVYAGETLGVVGESGCGKSTLGRVLVGLDRATAGDVTFSGKPLDTKSPWAVRHEVQIIFQDPYASLNPRMTVARAISEVLRVHELCPRKEIPTRLAELLGRVGLAADLADRRPHQLSGGERQRVVIARALAAGPRLIVADEAVSALDVSIRAQVLNLFTRLQDELELTYVFISHDLSVIRHISQRVVVMYLGRIVERAPTAELFRAPRHPYTQGLLHAIPSVDPDHRDPERALGGDVPDPISPPSGCAFHPRCPLATERCATEIPALRATAAAGMVACHHAEVGPVSDGPGDDRGPRFVGGQAV
ncbi:MAG: oligopeptide/dipeptide ABC transporter ATP-binding protein [Solirubrobacteraceae bacterium]